MASHENISNKSWEQRLALLSPLPSTQRVNSVHFSQHGRSPISSQQPSMNTTASDSNFPNYSEHHIPLSTSFRNETHGQRLSMMRFFPIFHSLGDMSMVNTIEDSQSVEGLARSRHSPSIERTKERSTPQVSTINTYRQQSTSATYENDHAELLAKVKRHSFPSMEDQQRRKFYIHEADDLSLQANHKGYLHKFISCFRRSNVDRSRYRNR